MIAEFSIVPLGAGESLSPVVARMLDIVEQSGISHTLTPMGTIVEGEWDKVMSVIKACHDEAAKTCNRVVTSIKIDDRKGVTDAIKRKTASVEAKRSKKR